MELKRRDFLNLAAALTATVLIEGPVTTFAASKEDKVANAAKSYVGSQNYRGWCLKLCSDAYAKAGYPFRGRYGSAIQAYNVMKRKVQRSDKKGALMFWDARPSRPDGHVAIYIGDGKVVTSWTAWGKYNTPNAVSIVSRSDMISKIPGFLGYCHIGDVITFR